MESVVEGLLYVQGDIGLTLKDIERILEIDEDEAKSVVLKLKNVVDLMLLVELFYIRQLMSFWIILVLLLKMIYLKLILKILLIVQKIYIRQYTRRGNR